jgi:exonuclease III
MNMVTSARDNSNPMDHTIGEQERVAFAALVDYLQIQDFFDYSGSLTFSWDNKRRQGIRTLKRMDRFYCFPSGRPSLSNHVTSYKILRDSTISDHLPMELKLELQTPKARRSSYKVNNFYLQDKEVIATMTEVW